MIKTPMKRIEALDEIAASFDVFFFDMFGTLWDGLELFPNTLPLLTRLKAAGKQVFILSNSTASEQLSEERVAVKGLIKGRHFDGYITAGETAVSEIKNGLFNQLIQRQDWCFYTLPWTEMYIPESLRTRRVEAVEDADILFLTWLCYPNLEPPETLDFFYPLLKKGLAKKMPFVCANPDYMAFRGDFKYLTLGAAARWYQEAGGDVYWVGKPYPQIYERALKRAGVLAEKAVMVGDTIRTDILGAVQAGMSSVLVETGVTAYEMRQGATLSERIAAEGATPHFILKEV